MDKKRTMSRLMILTIAIMIYVFTGINGCVFAHGDEESMWEQIQEQADIKTIEPKEDMLVTCEKMGNASLNFDILAFDVSEDKIVAVFKDPNKGFRLGIFDINMKAEQLYRIKLPGKNCGAVFHNENIVLFPDYSNSKAYATEITQDGEFVCMYKMYEQEGKNIKEIYSKRTIEENGNKFYISGDKSIPASDIMLGMPYLIKEDAQGHKVILYDCSTAHNKRTMCFAIISCAILLLCGICGYFQYIRPRRTVTTQQGTKRQQEIKEVGNPLDNFKRRKKQ